MGKKKFIDKKKAATFQLLARDTSDPVYNPENDRIFVRVDNNPVLVGGLEDEGHDEMASNAGYSNNPNSIFADAFDDGHDAEFSGSKPLPDHIRREILELGFPDDGYNYLLHLREITQTGGGSSYYHNPKANFDELPLDVKAYDASRVRIDEASGGTDDKTMYRVAEKSVNVRVQRAEDPEVAKLLEENESQLGSDVDDLEEDFVIQANLPGESSDPTVERTSNLVDKPAELAEGIVADVGQQFVVGKDSYANEKPRAPRLLDEQFDLLERQEYGTDSDEDYDDFVAEEDISLAQKLNNALKDHDIDDLDLDGEYKAPADILHENEGKKDGKLVNSAADVLRRCVEYAKNYENADEDDQDVVIVEESSDESEVWDCETIVSTYSTLDNHPGRIGAPKITRKNKLNEAISGALKNNASHMISLRGKEKMPVDYLPSNKKSTMEKAKVMAKTEQPKRRPHGQESKEEKKERKAAVKEERREARRAKKEMKELYRCEANRAQKVAAVSGPSSIHLM